MMFTLALKSFFSGALKFFSSITRGQWLILAGIVMFGFLQYNFYQWSHLKGQSFQFERDKVVIDQLKLELAEAKKEIARLHAVQDQIESNHQKAVAEWHVKETQLQSQLSARVQTQRTIQNRQRSLTREIPKLIPSHVDQYLPNGFVWLYNQSIQKASPIDGETALRYRTGGDASAPSAITLSRAAEVMISNNAECVYRGELIEAWQTYYRNLQSMHSEYQTQLDSGLQEAIEKANTKLEESLKETESKVEALDPRIEPPKETKKHWWEPGG